MHLDQNQVPHLLPSTNSLLPSSNTHSKDYTNAISEDEIIRYSLTTSSSSSSSSSLFFDTPEVQQQPQTSSSFSFTGVSFPYASTSNSPISTDPRRGSIGRHYANDSEPRVVDHNESAPFPSPIPSLPTVTSGDDTPTNSSITFYQGFRAIYPKFAKGFELTGLFKLSSISSTSQTPSTSTAASKGERRATSGLQLDRSLMIHSSTTTRKVGGGGNSFENSSSSLLSLSTSSVVGLGLAKHFASFGKKQSSEYLSVQTTTTTTTMATAANSTASANSASSGLSARSHSGKSFKKSFLEILS